MMILSNELRRGNWVRRGEVVGRVTQLLWNRAEIIVGTGLTRQYIEVDYDYLEPVALTAKIIHDAGFYKHELFPHRDAFHHHKYLFNINIVGNTYELSYGLIAQNIAMIYQRTLFLHQLQNLFFLLTNEELEIAL